MQKTLQLTEHDIIAMTSECLKSFRSGRPLNESVDEAVEEGLGQMWRKNVTHTANVKDVREAFAVLVTYFQQLGNQQALACVNAIAEGVNMTITKDKNRLENVDIESTAEDANQSVGSAAGNAAFNVGISAATLRSQMKKKAASTAAKTAAKTVAKTGAKTLATGALKALAGPVGWLWLAADVVSGANDIINAAKNAKDPSRAPREALATMYRYFQNKGKQGYTTQVYNAMVQLGQMVGWTPNGNTSSVGQQQQQQQQQYAQYQQPQYWQQNYGQQAYGQYNPYQLMNMLQMFNPYQYGQGNMMSYLGNIIGQYPNYGIVSENKIEAAVNKVINEYISRK